VKLELWLDTLLGMLDLHFIAIFIILLRYDFVWIRRTSDVKRKVLWTDDITALLGLIKVIYDVISKFFLVFQVDVLGGLLAYFQNILYRGIKMIRLCETTQRWWTRNLLFLYDIKMVGNGPINSRIMTLILNFLTLRHEFYACANRAFSRCNIKLEGCSIRGMGGGTQQELPATTGCMFSQALLVAQQHRTDRIGGRQ